MPASLVSLHCEITQPDRSVAASWRQIIRTCAGDLRQPVRVTRARRTPPAAVAGVTLHLPVELAAAQHPVWCLACRLACFLPQARVSVLVHGEQAFATVTPARPPVDHERAG